MSPARTTPTAGGRRCCRPKWGLGRALVARADGVGRAVPTRGVGPGNRGWSRLSVPESTFAVVTGDELRRAIRCSGTRKPGRSNQVWRCSPWPRGARRTPVIASRDLSWTRRCHRARPRSLGWGLLGGHGRAFRPKADAASLAGLPVATSRTPAGLLESSSPEVST